jgi:hypothetical protein
MFLAFWIVMSGLIFAAMLWAAYFLRSSDHTQHQLQHKTSSKLNDVLIAVAVESSLFIALEVSLMFAPQDIAVLPRPLPDALQIAILVGTIPFGVVALLAAVVVLFRLLRAHTISE